MKSKHIQQAFGDIAHFCGVGGVGISVLCFMLRKDRATKASAHLEYLQAQTHTPKLQLAKEPNFCRRKRDSVTCING